MFNPKKVVSLLIIAVSFVVFAAPTYAGNAKTAKVAKKQMAKKVKLQFDQQVYYRLPKEKRSQYLQIFMDLALQIETIEMKKNHKSAMNDFYQELNEILFPRAVADTNGICLNGGVFFEHTGPCSGVTNIPESYRAANLAPYYTCGVEKRCAAYFGVAEAVGSSPAQGFCFTSSSGATRECYNKSVQANGAKNLDALLARCVTTNSAQCTAFRDAMRKDSANIDKYCPAASTAGWCQAARSGIAALTSDTSAGATPAVPGAAVVNDTASKGCTQAEVDAISATLPTQRMTDAGLSRAVGTPIAANIPTTADPLWYKMLTMGASGGCRSGASYDDLVRKVGLCSRSGSNTVDIETEIRNNDALRDAINNFQSGAAVSQEQDRVFKEYFGLNTLEFNSFFCSGSTRASMGSFGNTLLSEAPRNNGRGDTRRNLLRDCVSRTIQKTPDRDGQDVWRSNSQYNTCSFRPANIGNINDLINNPDRFKGKIYFSDNITGACYGFVKAGENCSQVREQREFSTIPCSAPTATSTPGHVSGVVPGLVRLATIRNSGYADRIVQNTALDEGFTAFELSCTPSQSQAPCGIDNDHCNGTGTAN